MFLLIIFCIFLLIYFVVWCGNFFGGCLVGFFFFVLIWCFINEVLLKLFLFFEKMLLNLIRMFFICVVCFVDSLGFVLLNNFCKCFGRIFFCFLGMMWLILFFVFGIMIFFIGNVIFMIVFLKIVWDWLDMFISLIGIFLDELIIDWVINVFLLFWNLV